MALSSTGTSGPGRKPSAGRNSDSPSVSRPAMSKSANRTSASASQAENKTPKTGRSSKAPASDAGRAGRSPVRKAQTMSSGTTNGAGHNGLGEQSPVTYDETTSNTAVALQELQQRVIMAETAAAEYEKQAAALQKQLDDSLVSKHSSELQDESSAHKFAELEASADESSRAIEALQAKHDIELDRVQAQGKVWEDELAQIKASIARRERRSDSLTGTDSNSTPKAPRPGSSKVALSPELESLRTELAEAHVRIVELENRDIQHNQELENTIIELKMANARLMEESEGGFADASERPIGAPLAQLDLASKQRAVSASQAVHSTNALAIELGLTSSDAGSDRLLLEITALREQNKALSVYLNNIVSKILAHSELDGILDKDPELLKGSEILANIPTDTRSTPGGLMNDGAVAFSGFLQRTKSMMSTGSRASTRPPYGQRSDSMASSVASPNENPITAPRIPLSGRNGQRSISIAPRRGVSDSSGPAPLGTTNLRGRSPSKTVLSPDGISPPSATFPPRPESVSRAVSGSTFHTIGEADESVIGPSKRDSKIASSRNSVISEAGASDTSSPPRSNASNGSGEKRSGAIIMGGKPRPLRLVREAAEQDEAQRKAANRASWMGWFNKGPQTTGS